MKMKEFLTFNATCLDLDLGSGHTAYRRASVIDLYLYIKFHSNRRNSVDGRTYVVRARTDKYVRTDGQTSRPALLGRPNK